MISNRNRSPVAEWRLLFIPVPLCFPMPDRQAGTLDALLKSLPKTKEHNYRKAVAAKAPTEFNPGHRSDVSRFSTESHDHVKEVVVARGMNDIQFQANLIVSCLSLASFSLSTQEKEKLLPHSARP
jgi:hypothetical protein